MYKVKWYDPFDGTPEYSITSFPTTKDAKDAAEFANEKYGADLVYDVVNAVTHRVTK